MIKFKANPASIKSTTPWCCQVCGATENRGKWSDGWWANECVACVAVTQSCIAKFKSAANKLWFFGKKRPAGESFPGASSPAAGGK